MTEEDRERWDARYDEAEPATDARPGPPSNFATVADHFPTNGSALDIACGPGEGSVWLALRGMQVHGIDVSPVAIERARERAAQLGVADRCQFDVVDLDEGLPAGDPVDLVLCHLFRGEGLAPQMMERLAPGGLLAVAVLSEVGAEPGAFRAPPGELYELFGELEVLAEEEGDGRAWILARRAG